MGRWQEAACCRRRTRRAQQTRGSHHGPPRRHGLHMAAAPPAAVRICEPSLARDRLQNCRHSITGGIRHRSADRKRNDGRRRSPPKTSSKSLMPAAWAPCAACTAALQALRISHVAGAERKTCVPPPSWCLPRIGAAKDGAARWWAGTAIHTVQAYSLDNQGDNMMHNGMITRARMGRRQATGGAADGGRRQATVMSKPRNRAP